MLINRWKRSSGMALLSVIKWSNEAYTSPLRAVTCVSGWKVVFSHCAVSDEDAHRYLHQKLLVLA